MDEVIVRMGAAKVASEEFQNEMGEGRGRPLLY
jgi:hypothetical protein